MEMLAWFIVAVVTLLIVYLDIYAIVDAALSASKTTAVKSIWILVVLVMPVLGMVLYFIFGRK
jgi:hypothetical protein